MSETAMVHISRAKQALQKARTIDEIKKVIDVVERLRLYFKQQNESLEMQNDAAELGIYARHRAGEMIIEGKRNGDLRAEGDNDIKLSNVGATGMVAPTLKEVGIAHNQSSRWQSVAAIPIEQVQEIVQEYKEERKEISTAAILREVKEIQRERSEERRTDRITKIAEIAMASIDSLTNVGRYPLIYADPPWRYDFSKDDADQIENHYPTMTLEEICALPVAEASTDDCALFLWTTSPKLEEAFAALKAWGFTYRTCAIWDKTWIGPGYYFRQRHELLLVATKGNLPSPLPANRPDSIFTEKRTRHSRKPEIAYQLIEQMYPELPKLELFARSARAGWTAWGNESNREATAQ